MNVSRSGIGYSVGGRGMRVTHSPGGRVTRTISLPGTGLSHTTTLRSGSRSSSGRSASSRAPRSATPAPPPAPPKPGFLAPGGEKDLHKLLFGSAGGASVMAAAPTRLPAIARAHPDYRVLCAALDGLFAVQNGRNDRARELLAWVFSTRENLAAHPFVVKYLSAAAFTVAITVEVSVTLPLTQDLIGLAVAELHQGAGDLDAAIATIEECTPTTITAVSLADLYADAGRHADIVDLTDGIHNSDDPTALLCVLRGVALREQGFHDAAREAFKEALRFRSRSAQIRHRALLERGAGYLQQGRNAMARKDLEKILAEDSDYPGLREALNQLPN